MSVIETPIAITLLNDFIFCPASIYFHQLDAETDKLTYQCGDQINGSAAHKASDEGRYSDRTDILQAMPVFCERYGLEGKIDLFDASAGVLTERKRQITTIYDGYIFQLYAQFFALCEMGYQVRELRLYSMLDNKKYVIDFPQNAPDMLRKFENTIRDIRNFSFDSFAQTNAEKCKHCIYEPLCSYAKRGVI